MGPCGPCHSPTAAGAPPSTTCSWPERDPFPLADAGVVHPLEALATYVEGWDGKLPRNASGKLLKNAIRGEGHVSFAETM